MGRRWPAGIAAVVGTALLVSGVWWVIGRGADGIAPTVGAPGAGGSANPAASADEVIPPPATADENSIAVLPFVNMSGDPENEYFSDGLSEELINALVMVDGLKVAARTSAFAFRGQDRDVREIGAELGVENVLEGSVRKAGDRVRITAQLIHAEDGFHLWSETYDRQLDDIFAVQEEIASAISEQLELTLTPENRSTLARRRTDDLEAYDLYLLGRRLDRTMASSMPGSISRRRLPATPASLQRGPGSRPCMTRCRGTRTSRPGRERRGGSRRRGRLSPWTRPWRRRTPHSA